MKRIGVFITALMLFLVMANPCFSRGLTTGDQTIYGNKTFEHNIIVEGTIQAKGPTKGINAIGDVYYVGSTWGHDSPGNYGGTWDQPFATIDFAIGQCTANHGDTVYVLPWHAETVTSAITADVAGISIIGLTNGRNMPTLTPNGAIDALTITASDVTVANLRFGEPGTDEQTADINITGDRVSILGTEHQGSQAGSTENKVSIITITATAFDILLDGVRIHNKTTALSGAAILIEGVSERVEIRNCAVFDSIGMALGALGDGGAALQCYIHHNIFQCAQADDVCVEFGHNSTGVFAYNFVAGRDTTIADNIIEGNAMDFVENYIVEEAILSGLLHPAVDAD
jgi:hypothetical protein